MAFFPRRKIYLKPWVFCLKGCFGKGGGGQKKPYVRTIFPSAILGPEMAAPILWAPGSFWFFLLETPHAHKIPRFRQGEGVSGQNGVDLSFSPCFAC